jgi:1-acyl-sn-glycerol-3-phosphate acyltransferase
MFRYNETFCNLILVIFLAYEALFRNPVFGGGI